MFLCWVCAGLSSVKVQISIAKEQLLHAVGSSLQESPLELCTSHKKASIKGFKGHLGTAMAIFDGGVGRAVKGGVQGSDKRGVVQAGGGGHCRKQRVAVAGGLACSTQVALESRQRICRRPGILSKRILYILKINILFWVGWHSSDRKLFTFGSQRYVGQLAGWATRIRLAEHRLL